MATVITTITTTAITEAARRIRRTANRNRFYLSMYDVAKDDFEYSCNMIFYLSNTMKKSGDEEYAAKIEKRLNDLLSQLTGTKEAGNS